MGRKKKNEKEAFAADLHDIMDGAGTMKDTEIAEAFVAKGWRKQKEVEWISVDDRLPETEGTYLVYTIKGAIMFGKYFSYLQYQKPQFDYFVTHWMPLPEPPKGEKHES